MFLPFLSKPTTKRIPDSQPHLVAQHALPPACLLEGVKAARARGSQPLQADIATAESLCGAARWHFGWKENIQSFISKFTACDINPSPPRVVVDDDDDGKTPQSPR